MTTDDLTVQLATRVFANARKARAWLDKPNCHFDGRTPREELRRPGGEARVAEKLHAIDHGVW